MDCGKQEFIFKEEKIKNTVTEKILASDLKCAYICDGRNSELINYFRGGREEYLAGEERYLIRHEGKREEEILAKLGEKTVDLIEEQNHDFIFVSVGSLAHCAAKGDFLQSVQMVQKIDKLIEKLFHKLPESGVLILTSAYGSAEQMIKDKPLLPEFRKTDNPVPFAIISSENDLDLFSRAWNRTHRSELKRILDTRNGLIDVAPTILDIFNIPKPKAMEGIGLREGLKIR